MPIPTFPPVVIILPMVLLLNVADKADVALKLPTVIPVETFNVPVEIALPTAFVKATPEAVIAVTFAFVNCAAADVIPVDAFNVPVEMFVPTAFVKAIPEAVMAVAFAFVS